MDYMTCDILKVTYCARLAVATLVGVDGLENLNPFVNPIA